MDVLDAIVIEERRDLRDKLNRRRLIVHALQKGRKSLSHVWQQVKGK